MTSYLIYENRTFAAPIQLKFGRSDRIVKKLILWKKN